MGNPPFVRRQFRSREQAADMDAVYAVTVAQTAMWIAECKMMQETNAILAKNFTPLPLADSARIFEGNALKMEWGDLISRGDRENVVKFDYIMGNPPFVGRQFRSREQAADMDAVYADWKDVNHGVLDYVCAWYKKAADLMRGTPTRAAFVSTNSICQGELVAPMRRPLFERYGVVIDFAWRTFRWDSEAAEKAAVHCVIVGFHVEAEKNGRGDRENVESAVGSRNAPQKAQLSEERLRSKKHLTVRPWKANKACEALTILRSGTAERSETAEGRESNTARS